MAGQPLHPALSERLTRASDLGPNFFTKYAEQSSDLSDLRLRRSTDQINHLLASLQRRRGIGGHPQLRSALTRPDGASQAIARMLYPTVSSEVDDHGQCSVVVSLATSHPAHLHQILACYIDGLSAWATGAVWAAVVSDVRDRVPCTADGAHLLVALGAVRAIQESAGYEPLFEDALLRFDDGWDSFFVLLRYATAALKRRRNDGQYEVIATRAADVAGRLRSEQRDDGEFAMLLLDNLRALSLVRRRELDAADWLCRHIVAHAGGCRPSLPLKVYERYKVTFEVNQAVVAERVYGAAAAAKLLAKSASSYSDDPASLAEILGMQALFLVRSGRPADALRVLAGAIALSASRAGVTQLREMCRIAVAANADLGEESLSLKWLAVSQLEDPRQGMSEFVRERTAPA